MVCFNCEDGGVILNAVIENNMRQSQFGERESLPQLTVNCDVVVNLLCVSIIGQKNWEVAIDNCKNFQFSPGIYYEQILET